MSFEHNDIVFDNRLMAALGSSEMGFDHNDIVTVDRMNAAIAAGGGGGDFSTATITLTANKNGIIFAPIVVDGEESYVCQSFNFDEGENTLLIALYKGLAYGTIENATDATVTGDVEYEYGDIAVSGDGTVNVTIS